MASRRRVSSYARVVLAARLLLALSALAAGCGERQPEGPQLRVVDLVKQVGHVDVRPLGMRVQPTEHIFGGRTYASLLVDVPSRLTWKIKLPDRAVLRAIAALPEGSSPARARFRVGISDGRFYQGLGEWVLEKKAAHPEWTTLAVDLSRFTGRHLSVLFPPTDRVWQITLSIDATADAGVACWADVGIDTDARSARTFFKSAGLTRP